MNSSRSQSAAINRPTRIIREASDGININFFWREAMFGVQFDYPEDSRKQRMLNRLEDDELRKDGIEIMRVNADEFDQHPEQVIARVSEALARRTKSL